MSSRKRKHARRGSPDYNAGGEGTSSAANAIFVQGHEATIIRDPDGSRALITHDHGGGKGGLIQWQGDGENEREVWVDRHDARLLLTSLPISTTRTYVPAFSPTGWSDLPSDSEDTFFFSAEEIEDLRREKRRKTIDAGREERLRALREADPDPVRDFEDDRVLWGGDDEEPDETQRTLMERTARHLLSSPNPGQLEMRILANHGSDNRFSFLRGRWRNAWQRIRLVVKSEKDTEQKGSVVQTNVVGGLVAYGDSDEDDDEEASPDFADGETSTTKLVDDSEMQARRTRAREWAKKRNESKPT